MAFWEKGGEVLTRIVAVPHLESPGPPGSLQKARSAPALTLRRPDLPEEKEAKVQRAEFRAGLADLLSHLDDLSAARRKAHAREEWAAKAKEIAKAGYRRSLESSRRLEKPAWTYCPDGGYFEKPQYEQGGSLTSVKNDLLQGIYGVKDEKFKPPHCDDGSYIGTLPWRAHTRNDKSQTLAEFGTMDRKRMSRQEKVYADRLDHALDRATKLAQTDAKRMTSGSYKRQLIERSAPEFSALRGDKKAWTTQAVATHVYFSQPKPSEAGDHLYKTGLAEYISQPTRAKDYSRDIVIGDHSRTSFWKPRATGKGVGSSEQLALAEDLLHPGRKMKAHAKQTGACPRQHA